MIHISVQCFRIDAQITDAKRFKEQAASLKIIQKIAAREITGTFFNDSRVLAEACADTILTYLKDETPEVSDYQQYDNGLRLVRSITCESEYVDQDDYKKLVDSGYYKESDITPYIPVPEAEMPTEQK